jgi:ketosteroid isomerase-like protein
MKKSALAYLAAAASVSYLLGAHGAAAATTDELRAKAYFQAIAGGNADTVASFYADKAEFHWVGGPLAGIYKGKTQIRGVWQKFIEAAGTVKHKVVEISESHNGKISTVTARVNFIGPKEVPVKFILTYEDGKITSEIWQVDKEPETYAKAEPAPAAETPAAQPEPEEQPAEAAAPPEQQPGEEPRHVIATITTSPPPPAPEPRPATPEIRQPSPDTKTAAAEIERPAHDAAVPPPPEKRAAEPLAPRKKMAQMKKPKRKATARNDYDDDYYEDDDYYYRRWRPRRYYYYGYRPYQDYDYGYRLGYGYYRYGRGY